MFSVHSIYSVYSAYSTYSVYSVNSVYLVYNMNSVYSVYSVYSAYNAYSVLFPRPLGQQLRLGPKEPQGLELLFMLSMVSQKSKVRSISKFYDRCKSIGQNVFDAQQQGTVRVELVKSKKVTTKTFSCGKALPPGPGEG